MRRLMIVVGVLWALIGFWNIVLMPWGGPSQGILVFGLIFNMVAFVLPGLVVGGIGYSIKIKTIKEGNHA